MSKPREWSVQSDSGGGNGGEPNRYFLKFEGWAIGDPPTKVREVVKPEPTAQTDEDAEYIAQLEHEVTDRILFPEQQTDEHAMKFDECAPWVETWVENYSNPAEFEESGQREAMAYGHENGIAHERAKHAGELAQAKFGEQVWGRSWEAACKKIKDLESQLTDTKADTRISQLEVMAAKDKRIAELEAEVKRLHEKYDLQLLVKKCERLEAALKRIAGEDYRGNMPNSARIAGEALKGESE